MNVSSGMSVSRTVDFVVGSCHLTTVIRSLLASDLTHSHGGVEILGEYQQRKKSSLNVNFENRLDEGFGFDFGVGLLPPRHTRIICFNLGGGFDRFFGFVLRHSFFSLKCCHSMPWPYSFINSCPKTVWLILIFFFLFQVHLTLAFWNLIGPKKKARLDLSVSAPINYTSWFHISSLIEKGWNSLLDHITDPHLYHKAFPWVRISQNTPVIVFCEFSMVFR